MSRLIYAQTAAFYTLEIAVDSLSDDAEYGTILQFLASVPKTVKLDVSKVILNAFGEKVHLDRKDDTILRLNNL